MKIAIIGNAGSGKSSLSLAIQKKFDIPLYHLDQYFWKPGWVEPDRNEFEKIHNQLCDKPQWIIEGMAIRFFEYRIKHADIIVFLDMPTYVCLYRVYKRALTNYGYVYFSSAKGCQERGPDLKFLKFIWYFNKRRKPIIKELLQKYHMQKHIFTIHSQRELNAFINNLGSIK